MEEKRAPFDFAQGRRVYAQALHHLARKAQAVAGSTAILSVAPPPLDERVAGRDRNGRHRPAAAAR